MRPALRSIGRSLRFWISLSSMLLVASLVGGSQLIQLRQAQQQDHAYTVGHLAQSVTLLDARLTIARDEAEANLRSRLLTVQVLALATDAGRQADGWSQSYWYRLAPTYDPGQGFAATPTLLATLSQSLGTTIAEADALTEAHRVPLRQLQADAHLLATLFPADVLLAADPAVLNERIDQFCQGMQHPSVRAALTGGEESHDFSCDAIRR